MKEIEIKILEFDEDSLRSNLSKMKAEYLGKSMFKRVVFDMGSHGAITDDEFIRVRTDGKKTTLAYKHRENTNKSLDNTHEIEVEAGDFDRTVEIISKIWRGRAPYYQENNVERWVYKDLEISICTWPHVPQFLEIEGSSEEEVRNAIKELEVKGIDIGNTNLVYIFERYGHKDEDAGELRF